MDKLHDQLTLHSSSRLHSENDFKTALRNFFACRGETDYQAALDELNKARTVLILEFGYGLEELAKLADET